MTARMRICFLMLINCLMLLVDANAQTTKETNNVFGGYLFMPIEFPVIDTKGLNQGLTANGLPSAKYSTAAIGLGLQLYTNRFITTLSFNKITKKDNQDAFSTEVEYRSTSFNVGYSLTKSQWFSLYPYVGFKGSGLNYLYRQKAANPISMGNYLQTNLDYKELTNSRGHLDLGIGIAHQWFYLVNCRFGYLLPLEKVRWNIDNNQNTLTGSPGINYNCYFSLILGIGNITSDDALKKHYGR